MLLRFLYNLEKQLPKVFAICWNDQNKLPAKNVPNMVKACLLDLAECWKAKDKKENSYLFSCQAHLPQFAKWLKLHASFQLFFLFCLYIIISRSGENHPKSLKTNRKQRPLKSLKIWKNLKKSEFENKL